MPTPLDHEFVRSAARAADRLAAPLAADPEEEPAGVPHRGLARRVKTLVATYRSPDSELHGGKQAVAAAMTQLRALRAAQTTTGLFAGGDNVQSPPDSAFTVNDVCDAHVLAAGAGPELHDVTAALAEIAGAASGALLTGGVHTPNHRWELCAALARLHRSFPDYRLLDRVEEWLSEGVDIDAEGLYSERSANYAAHVSNPSLLLLADVLGRADLLDAVERNLATTLDLIRPDGTVETVHSRRQDQKHPFHLAPYLPHYRLLAIRTGRGDFGRAARLAAAGGIDDPDLLAQTLLTPDLCRALPTPDAETLPRTRYITTARLAARASADAHTVVYGGSDVPQHRRIRSGLACNPTFLRLFAGHAVLDAVRLTRGFFDLGPFRAADMRQLADNRYRLTETLTAAYYQPLPPDQRRDDGVYRLVDEGRFSAAMAFPDRPRDEVSHTTRVDVDLREDGADLRFDISGPRVPWALELTFRPGGVTEGAVPIGDGRWCLTTGPMTYRVGDDEIRVEADVEAGEPLAGPDRSDVLRYDPGQDYTVVGGTDATTGNRVYIGGLGSHTLTVALRARRSAPVA
ncbi:hypothetical protein ACM01_00270 [Streptomyces viridochromogenes]|uniref:Uncharacterized protein n=1 Tax=Streptomyces viridochromogenes TaxID=1938 RepID=A0A0J7ZPQ4_STRVR|nr:hypothetical protein [Streptomyces viridochromogenes]KMS77118.1 hypothetical protein ACM01_00270 [Streptomyces viridochromogenes]KOG09361.1 hypothetical protein ADK35_40015 [Streptomyces viridochromogenes]KOG27268.1 hypothetical protein ADK36_01580 [Streptomyces viridochromogenes]